MSPPSCASVQSWIYAEQAQHEKHLPGVQEIQAALLFHPIAPATHPRYKPMMWGTSLQGVQRQIPQDSRDTSLLPLERDREGFSTFVQNCFEGFPFVKSHQLTWERKRRRGQIRRKAEAGDDLEQWKYLLLALDPRLWSTLIKTYQFFYFRATKSPQVSEGQQVFPANLVSETSLRFLPFQDSNSASRVQVQVHFPLQHPLISLFLSLPIHSPTSPTSQ